MLVVKIKKSDKDTIYKLAAEEDKILQRYASHPIYRVRFFEDVI